MSVKHLRTLVAIADHRTFSDAADSLCLTHAAVSQHVSALEEEIGVALFDRSRRTPVLNATGRALVQRARTLLRDYDSLYASVLGRDMASGDLQVGVLPTVLSTLAPRAILRLRESCPGLRLQIRPGLTAPLLTAIERAQLDGAVVTLPPNPPESLKFEPIADEPLMLIASEQLAGDNVMDLLQSQPFIRFNRDAVVGTMIEGWLQANHVNVRETMELSSLDSITSMVFANIGVSIVPRPSARPFNPLPLRWLPLDDRTPSRGLALAYRRTTSNAWALDEVLAAFRASCDDSGPPADG